ncbi:MAG: AmmeMemoRadiSam system radical SAM enzyme [Elusimicrobiales bacterium]
MDYSRRAELFSKTEGGAGQCHACAHDCIIPSGGRGICGMRFNRDGEIFAPWGYVSALACDPVEKKPFFHLLPGEKALSFGMPGCNFRCRFCQNWELSQTCENAEIMEISPEKLAASASGCGARIMAATYNEPLISAEWAKAVFEEAGKKGLVRAFVSNGFASQKAVEYMRPALEAWKIDLKCFDDGKYREIIGGRLQPVLDTIKLVHSLGIWTEIVTLVVPDFNDSEAGLAQTARFIASVSPEIPWHVTAFHPDYKMTGSRPAAARDLERAARAGRAAGLKYVYSGNIPGGSENTVCPDCSKTLVERAGYGAKITGLAPSKDGKTAACKHCGAAIPGIFSGPAAG